VADLQSWTSEVESWPAGSHVWGHYLEETASGAVLCRTENVSACHQGFRSLVEGPLEEIASKALADVAADFKDKINYKHPGGGGFSPHQDLTAYPGVSEVVSILLAIDECTLASGCLWLATEVDEQLPTDDRGVILEEVVSSLEWHPIELGPGDTVCLAGSAPHFSKANEGATRRRVLVASYAPRQEGYTRGHYYAAREASMTRSSETGEDFRISTLADFEGRRSRDVETKAAETCTHD
jgi:Phytanoyl-CoA dioxygenase (PhyH)